MCATGPVYTCRPFANQKMMLMRMQPKKSTLLQFIVAASTGSAKGQLKRFVSRANNGSIDEKGHLQSKEPKREHTAKGGDVDRQAKAAKRPFMRRQRSTVKTTPDETADRNEVACQHGDTRERVDGVERDA
jgi:hypothetical protein